jgi:endogenous inhibitor of DNA gyrase (YacG/DUF329 family)
MTAPPKPKLCPHCSKPADPLFRPFCSKHCKDIDLGRWLNEDYRVPVVEEDKGDDQDDGRE